MKICDISEGQSILWPLLHIFRPGGSGPLIPHDLRPCPSPLAAIRISGGRLTLRCRLRSWSVRRWCGPAVVRRPRSRTRRWCCRGSCSGVAASWRCRARRWSCGIWSDTDCCRSASPASRVSRSLHSAELTPHGPWRTGEIRGPILLQTLAIYYDIWKCKSRKKWKRNIF